MPDLDHALIGTTRDDEVFMESETEKISRENNIQKPTNLPHWYVWRLSRNEGNVE